MPTHCFLFVRQICQFEKNQRDMIIIRNRKCLSHFGFICRDGHSKFNDVFLQIGSRAHCRCNHRLSCSTSDVLDPDHHDSSTRYTWRPQTRYRSQSLQTHQSQEQAQLHNSLNHLKSVQGVFGTLFISHPCKAPCTDDHIH